MRDRVRSKVEIAESPTESADVRSAIVVRPTAPVLVSIGSEITVFLGELAGAAPFRSWQYEILPERSSRPVTVCYFKLL